MTEQNERIAILEEKAVEAARERGYLNGKLDMQSNHIKEIRDDIHSIKLQLTGFRGFWAGMVFAASAAAAVVGGGVAAAWNKLFS